MVWVYKWEAFEELYLENLFIIQDFFLVIQITINWSDNLHGFFFRELNMNFLGMLGQYPLHYKCREIFDIYLVCFFLVCSWTLQAKTDYQQGLCSIYAPYVLCSCVIDLYDIFILLLTTSMFNHSWNVLQYVHDSYASHFFIQFQEHFSLWMWYDIHSISM